MNKTKKYFLRGLCVITLGGLGIELLLRPLWPDLVKSESVLGDIIRLVLSVLAAFGLTGV